MARGTAAVVAGAPPPTPPSTTPAPAITRRQSIVGAVGHLTEVTADTGNTLRFRIPPPEPLEISGRHSVADSAMSAVYHEVVRCSAVLQQPSFRVASGHILSGLGADTTSLSNQQLNYLFLSAVREGWGRVRVSEHF